MVIGTGCSHGTQLVAALVAAMSRQPVGLPVVGPVVVLLVFVFGSDLGSNLKGNFWLGLDRWVLVGVAVRVEVSEAHLEVHLEGETLGLFISREVPNSSHCFRCASHASSAQEIGIGG